MKYNQNIYQQKSSISNNIYSRFNFSSDMTEINYKRLVEVLLNELKSQYPNEVMDAIISGNKILEEEGDKNYRLYFITLFAGIIAYDELKKRI